MSLGPGRVDLGFHRFEGPPSDEAAFAVSWTSLFDEARLSPDRVVEAAERRSAGKAVVPPPTAPTVLEAPGAATLAERRHERAAALRALLAGAAAVLGLVALGLLARRAAV